MATISREQPDQDDVVALIRQSATLMESLYAVTRDHRADVTALMAPNVHLFVARDDGQALGCCALIARSDQTDPSYGEPKRLFVVPAARGKGVASALLERVESEALRLGLTWIRIEVGVRQAEAIALYRKFSYVERGAFGGYRTDPLSAFMEKRLS